MKLKWLGVGAILLLGAILVVLQEYASPSSDHSAAARTVRQPRVLGAGRGTTPGEVARLKRNGPGVVPVVTGAHESPAGVDPASVLPEPTDEEADEDRPAGPSDKLTDVLAAAESLRAEGRASEAVEALRAAMQRSHDTGDVARAGLLLAPLTDDLAERRRLLTAALREDVVSGAEFEAVGGMLRALNHNSLNSLHPLVELARYTVVPGDNLWTLCNKRFGTLFGASPEVGLVKLVNGLASDTLKVGQVLLVPTAPLRIEIRTRQHGLTVWLGDVALAGYRVGLGKEGRTPRTSFTVKVKQQQPSWFSGGKIIPYGDPRNVLGTRWMGFDDKPGASGFGIHGTSDPESIGADRSMGCIRLRNDEVEELFDYVSRGTPVTIL